MDIFTRGVPAILLLILLVSPAWPQTNVSLVGHVAIGGGFVTDVWEYVDTTTGNRYALVGTFGTVSIVDVTDAANPAIVTTIGVPGFDVKVWGQYMYGVTGGGGTNQGKIVDLTDPASPQIVASFNSAHNIFISESGYLFAESPGLKVYDLNPDPLAPALVWDSGDGGGHDAAVIGNMVYDFHGDATNIYEASFGSPFSLNLLGTIDDPAIAYHHSGWTSEDGRYLFICDELADHPTPDITVWDISDPLYPVNVDDYADPNATVHNLYVIGRFAYVSYYTSGFRVFDVTDPIMISVAGDYDTSPSTGQGFDGAFGVYPFSSPGNIYVSDQTGLYVLAFDSTTVDAGEPTAELPDVFILEQNYPNPFNPGTTITYRVPGKGFVELKVFDLIGREVATLVNEAKEPGTYRVEWDATGQPSGVYFYRMVAGDVVQVRKMSCVR